MEINEHHEEDVVVFKISGRLDSNTSQEFDRRIFEAIDQGSRRLVVDCEKLDYITSAGLRVLNKTAKRLRKENGGIVLCAMVDYVREVFEIAGFDTFLPIVDTLDNAVVKVRLPQAGGA